MKQKIKLSTIIDKYLKATYLTSGVKISDRYATYLKAMANEIFELALDLAAENAYVEYMDLETKEKFDYTDVITDNGVGADVSKQSILQIKDWIK